MTRIIGWMAIPDLAANLHFARAGWDVVVLDAQHGLFDEAAIARTLAALAAPTPRRLVRTVANDAGAIGKLLDLGADGVIAPMINSPDDARRLADACRYPPRGQRSYGPVLAALRAGDRTPIEAADRTEVLAMIETRAALAAVESIAAVDGITGLFVGPNDLSISHGFGPGSDREEPEMLDAYRRILDAAHGAGRTAGIFVADPAYAPRMLALGFDDVTASTDLLLLASAAARARATATGRA